MKNAMATNIKNTRTIPYNRSSTHRKVMVKLCLVGTSSDSSLDLQMSILKSFEQWWRNLEKQPRLVNRSSAFLLHNNERPHSHCSTNCFNIARPADKPYAILRTCRTYCPNWLPFFQQFGQFPARKKFCSQEAA